MYCSMMFFLDRNIEEKRITDFDIILKALSMLKNKLHLECCKLEYSLDNPDKSGSYILHSKKNWAGDYKTPPFQFDIIPSVQGKYGDVSHTFINYYDSLDAGGFYYKSSIDIIYPSDNMSMFIKVFFKVKEEIVSDYIIFAEIIEELEALGLFINNSFLHLYNRKKESSSLIGMQVGSLTTLQQCNNIKRFQKHMHEYKLVDHLMDVYFVNSIKEELLDEEQKKCLIDIVGEKHVFSAGHSLVFTLPDDQEIMFYRLKNRKAINEIRELLKV